MRKKKELTRMWPQVNFAVSLTQEVLWRVNYIVEVSTLPLGEETSVPKVVRRH